MKIQITMIKHWKYKKINQTEFLLIKIMIN